MRSPKSSVGRLLGAMGLLTVSGCSGWLGNFDAPDGATNRSNANTSLLATLLGFKRNDVPAAPGTEVRHISCPEVVVLEGTAASQAYAGSPPSNANLRYQYALTDTARECKVEDDQLVLKIGVAGKVLLGPAGAPGSFNVPVRMAVLHETDNSPVTSKLYHAPVTIGPSESEASFTIVSDPLEVPFIQDHAEQDYTIKVGIDEGPSTEKSPGKGNKPRG
ncbi:MAG: hypothetical protein FWD08_00835 [Alphaproteobacteria bacterium]|nr:hypothetical protein [Alphaproteobacteria bacterium]